MSSRTSPTKSFLEHLATLSTNRPARARRVAQRFCSAQRRSQPTERQSGDVAELSFDEFSGLNFRENRIRVADALKRASEVSFINGVSS